MNKRTTPLHRVKLTNFTVAGSLFIAAALVSGCASHTGVIPLGDGSYMISKQQATGFPGLGNMKAELIVEASAYCIANGQHMKLLDASETAPPYILGNYPRSEIRFTCLSDKTPRPKSMATPV